MYVGGGRQGEHGDDKLWFMCICDNLMLWLYSHQKPPPKSWPTLLRGDLWSLERQLQLWPRIEDLTNKVDEVRARNMQSQNGYVFFAMDK
jgi:hypothetical protein